MTNKCVCFGVLSKNDEFSKTRRTHKPVMKSQLCRYVHRADLDIPLSMTFLTQVIPVYMVTCAAGKTAGRYHEARLSTVVGYYEPKRQAECRGLLSKSTLRKPMVMNTGKYRCSPLDDCYNIDIYTLPVFRAICTWCQRYLTG